MRSRLVIAISTSAGIVLAIVVGVFVGSGNKAASAQGVPGGGYMWSYATKFVCGTESPGMFVPIGSKAEPPVKPGNYATDINIHNPNYQDNVIFKKMIIMVGETTTANGVPGEPFVHREPDTTKPSKFVTLPLGPDYATMDDCQALTRLAKQAGAIGAGSFMMGYLVVLSRLDIDVDAIYTAEVYSGVNAVGPIPAGIALEIVHVTGKRVFVPGGVLPGANADGN